MGCPKEPKSWKRLSWWVLKPLIFHKFGVCRDDFERFRMVNPNWRWIEATIFGWTSTCIMISTSATWRFQTISNPPRHIPFMACMTYSTVDATCRNHVWSQNLSPMNLLWPRKLLANHHIRILSIAYLFIAHVHIIPRCSSQKSIHVPISYTIPQFPQINTYHLQRNGGFRLPLKSMMDPKVTSVWVSFFKRSPRV